jgi:hypothetical protein
MARCTLAERSSGAPSSSSLVGPCAPTRSNSCYIARTQLRASADHSLTSVDPTLQSLGRHLARCLSTLPPRCVSEAIYWDPASLKIGHGARRCGAHTLLCGRGAAADGQAHSVSERGGRTAVAATLFLRRFSRGTRPRHAATSIAASVTRCACAGFIDGAVALPPFLTPAAAAATAAATCFLRVFSRGTPPRSISSPLAAPDYCCPLATVGVDLWEPCTASRTRSYIVLIYSKRSLPESLKIY